MSYDEKVNVSIDSDGDVLKCAKGLASGECGFVKGAKICAKCGAVPVEMKMVPVSGLDGKSVMSEDMTEDMMPEMSEDMVSRNKKKKKKPSMKEMYAEMDDEEMAEDEEESMAKKRMVPEMQEDVEPEMDDMDEEDDENLDTDADEEEMDSESEKMYGMGPKGRRKFKAEDMDMSEDEMDEDEEDEEDMDMEEEDMDMEEEAEEGAEDEEEMDEDEEEDTEEKSFDAGNEYWDALRETRIKSMGIKPSDIGASGYVCSLERKAYAGSAPVCDDCPGGCIAEKGMPGILHVEGLAEQMFNGRVIDSGYSADADMFVVDVQTKSGDVKEIFIDGTTAEVMGFHKLDVNEFEQKSEASEYKLIDFTEAAEIAVKSFDGHVVAVEPDVFEGFDSYAVEIEGFDGKSYDVFVALDGEVLGYDRYEQDEAEAIEAEAAELALKRAFNEERRMDLAKEGMALPDGSYPIVTEADLRNAIQAFGRAKDKEAAKKHIMKRARALKLESLIPANWIAGASEKNEVPNDANFLASLVEFQLLEEQIDNL
jgi:uncharacterized membrane protein YkoI